MSAAEVPNMREQLAAGKALFGSFAFLPSPDVIEIMALAGFDYAIIDFEHSPKDWSTVQHMIRAAQVRGMAPMVRVRENSGPLILQALESGAAGIVVPFIQQADDVRSALDALRYAPEGHRGSCSVTRAAEYGRQRPGFLAHCAEQNERIPLVGLIESASAVAAIDEIVGCQPGLDAVMVGRSDLAASLGRPGQTDDPAVIEATMRVIHAARKASKPVAVCMVVYDAADARRWLDQDCRMLCYPSDSVMILEAARKTAEAVRDAIRTTVGGS